MVQILNSIGWVFGAVFDFVGNGLAGLLDTLGNSAQKIPGVGAFLRGLFHWLATIISAFFDVPATAIRGVFNFLANGLTGLTRIVSTDKVRVRQGVGDVFSGLGGAVVAIIAKVLAFAQAVLFQQLGERPLNAAEKELLKRVYRGSVALGEIRLIEGRAGIFHWDERPFTLGNRIYFKHVTDAGTLVHEVCHVWQFQREGTRYITDALWAQRAIPDAYNWRKEIERGKVRWQDFNKEAQAQLIQDVYNSGRKPGPAHVAGEFFEDDPIHPNTFYKHKDVDYTELARAAITLIRNKGKS